MQKKDLNASILIWAIFISLIITTTFIQINLKINKNLKNNSSVSNNILLNNSIKNIINSWSLDWVYTDELLSNWDEIIYDNSYKKDLSLKKSENTLLKIISSDNVTITINEWWPIIYTNNLNTWIIINSNSFTSSIWELTIENLWWFTRVEIVSDTENSILPEYTNYKISKTIWNKEIIKTRWTIKNF